MQSDQAANIQDSGRITAPNIGAYAFGTGDFTVAALIQTTHGGTLVSKKSTEGGAQSCAGWLVVVKPDGTIKFATDNGYGFYEVNSVPTTALNGEWHHVACVRRSGAMSVYFDLEEIQVTPRHNLPSPLDVSGEIRLMMGGTDQTQEPHNQYTGILEDVTIFARALTREELIPTVFNLLTGSEPGLVGLWRMNDGLTDDSPSANTGTAHGNVSFVPVYHTTWADGANAFSFCSIRSLYGQAEPGDREAARETVGSPNVITQTQVVTVAEDAPFLCAVMNGQGGLFKYPENTHCTIRKPDGKVLDREVDTEDLLVKLVEGSVLAVVQRDPQPGDWEITITAPEDVALNFTCQTLPSSDLMATITNTLTPCYPPAESGPLLAQAALSSPWSYIGTYGVAAVGTIFLVTTGAVTVPTAVVGLAAFGFAVEAKWAYDIITDMNAAKLTPPVAAQQTADYVDHYLAGGPKTLTQVWRAVVDKVGVPATTDPAKFASRADMGVDAAYPIHLDVGGEGYHEVFGIRSGFERALNLNDKTQDSQPPHGKIPMLVLLTSFSTDPQYPFTDGIANLITLQGAPLTPQNVSEFSRLVAPGGRIGLWIDRADFQPQIDQLADLLHTTPRYSTDPHSGCVDEFDGAAGFPKICLLNERD